MKRPRYFLFLIATLLTIQIVWYTILTVSYIKKGQVEGSDFRWFYAVGKVSRQYGSGAVYDLELAAIAQAQVAGTAVGEERILLPNHPPFVYPVMALLADLDFRQAYNCYLLGVWIFTAAIMSTLYLLLRKRDWPRLDAFLLSCSVLLFEPFFISVLKGQDTYILLIGGLFLLFSFIGKKDWLAGIGLGLMLIRPQIALILAIPFLFRKQRVWWWFLATAALLGIYSFIQIGWSGIRDYIVVLGLSTGVEGFGWDEVGMFDAVGLIMRMIPTLDLDLIHVIGWIFYLASMVGLSILWSSSKAIQQWHLSLAVILGLFAAPHLHYHDLALLAVPLVGLVVAGVERKKIKISTAGALPMITSIVFLFSEFWDPARLTFPYLLMAGLPVWTWWVERDG
jgi:hypothetical protein